MSYSDKRGQFIVIAAPSGTGKTSLAAALSAAHDDIAVSISHTTRAPRPGEQNGINYFFVDKKTFFAMVEDKAFVEHAEVFGHHYGTSHAMVDQLLDAGQHVLLDIDWQGARSIKKQAPNAITVFILPPSITALEERLRGRQQDSEAVINERMRKALHELMHYTEFDHLIVNDDFEAALADLEAIVNGNHADVRPMNMNIDELRQQAMDNIPQKP